MSKWLQSGRRRDVCFLLVADGPLRGQQLKSRLEAHYDDRLEPKSFYGSLSALVDAGSSKADGGHPRRLRAHRPG